ncbi:Aste57867_2916 [Aphanomyces stellatus]|uniref:Aste57867_2916 protein n=1 Tax=Aphanomyces stellatus TaxID=120398 RepID=A0A485K8K4_9STRA|nr:hypothetical protein As57867_002908 [Aphanomyces stellatus]VFT80099.1 Aste57867_2916 [Aphanomyces stellatus]
MLHMVIVISRLERPMMRLGIVSGTSTKVALALLSLATLATSSSNLLSHNCPKERPCTDTADGAGCYPGNATLHDGSGRAWCGDMTIARLCSNAEFCYDWFTTVSACICTGTRPCKASGGICEPFSAKCMANDRSNWCPTNVLVPTSFTPNQTIAPVPVPPGPRPGSVWNDPKGNSFFTVGNIVGIAIGSIVGLVVLCQLRARCCSTPPASPIRYGRPVSPQHRPKSPPSHAPTTTTKTDTSADTYSSHYPASETAATAADMDLTELLLYRIHVKDVQLSQKPVGQGGFGQVFYATWNNDPVAVKRLLPEMQRNQSAVSDFIAEIKLLAKVQCEYIVEFKGATWTRPMDIQLVMEWLDRDLNHFLETNRPGAVTWIQRLQIAHDIAQALSFLHTKNVIHRDLKTRNVLLTADLRAKLTDFGISRQAVLDQSMTAGIGTRHWMAPEVQRGGRYDKSADLYSFGVLLFVLDTHGALPVAMTGRAAPEFASCVPPESQALPSMARVAFSAAAPLWYVELSRKCILQDPRARPPARRVALELEQRLSEAYSELVEACDEDHTMYLV